MRKSFFILTLLAACVTLCAQEKENFDGNDLLEVFLRYNPAVLERATTNEMYGKLLAELSQQYSAVRNEQSSYEMIALAKNFDNSLLLRALHDQYFQYRTLAAVSNIETPSLEQDTLHDLQVVMEDVFQNTLDVKKLQLSNQKTQLKVLRKNKTLAKEDKQAQQEELSEKIRQTKQEISFLKKHAKQQITATAQVYLDQMRADFEAAQQTQQQAEESSSYDVKANHKKPVAE